MVRLSLCAPLFALCALTVIETHPAFGQTESGREVTAWIHIGLGAGTPIRSGATFAGDLSGNIRYRHLLATIRTASVGELLGWSMEDYGILVGYAGGENHQYYSIAAGIGRVRRIEGGIFSSRIYPYVYGCPLEIQWNYRPFGWFGFGVCFFTLFSQYETYAGVTLSLHLGLLR
jgi:hypothetical protein